MVDTVPNMSSAEQQLNIANYFIMSAPIGEVDDVVNGTSLADVSMYHTCIVTTACRHQARADHT